ncbi:hypothetical protein EJB05_04680 [Eragrostis curvula]|uniref:Uncharacterized protein n=1 Tax=Eragrostis curvula TaxID=38414 RepID=A0A5J9WD05_9POAL|nr:hypothetical protein EJB05_04680 [Eragrostis curvula]
MASMKLSFAFTLLLLSGLVVFGEIGVTAAAKACNVQCIQGGYITCDNYPEQQEGCACQCAPRNGRNCVLHLQSGSSYNCTAQEY